MTNILFNIIKQVMSKDFRENQQYIHFNRFIYAASLGDELMDKVIALRPKIISLTQQYNHMSEIPAINNLTKKEQMFINASRYSNTFKIAKQLPIQQQMLRNIDYFYELYGITLNVYAFLVTIQLLGTPEQSQYWKQQIFSQKVLGCYAQTELGHGSDVQRIQITATYDEKTESFIFNSPKITASKFWPGGLGIFSTHAVLQARTIVKGKFIGIHTFVLQIRNINLQCLDGVQSGDIGQKLGFHRVDNGYLVFNNYRAPRSSLLMKFIKVKPCGEVQQPLNKNTLKYAYGSMLNLRVKFVNGFALAYIIIPNAFCMKNNVNQLKNYQLQNKENIQKCCTAYGFVLANIVVRNIYQKFLNALQKQNFNEADGFLVDCHILSSTFKALSSWKAIQLTTHSFVSNYLCTHQASGVYFPWTDCIPTSTYEGDNSVLLQLTAKYAIMKQAEQQKAIIKPQKLIDPSKPQTIYEAFSYMVSMEAIRIKAQFQKESDKGTGYNTFWNQVFQRQIIQFAKLWGNKMLIKSMIDGVKQIDKYQDFYQNIVCVALQCLCKGCKELAFYGFQFKDFNCWKKFKEVETWMLFWPGSAIYANYEHEDIKYVQDVEFFERSGSWIRSRL